MHERAANLERLSAETFDALIVGGGINGAVAAAALCGRGARVALIDARDFAGFTSQHSSNLAWGGIKYMESWEFPLVWGLCQSRNDLMRDFPSTVREIRFLATVRKRFRHHPLLLWVGTWLYWLMGRGFTRTPRYLSAAAIKRAEPAIEASASRGGVEYSDAYLHDNDARFVFRFVRSAMDRGCVAANYVRSLGARQDENGEWVARARDEVGGAELEIRARVLVNAAGAFVDEHNALSGIETEYRHVFSKGIHLIVDRLGRKDRVLAFFADDGRLFFAIPMFKTTCIGTTDTRVDDPHTRVEEDDRDFVLDNINAMLDLERPLTRADVIAERCGVRPLAVRKGASTEKDFLQLSRKHVVEVDDERRHLSIFGGKLTDCINVGDEVCEIAARLGVRLPQAQAKWFGEAGADLRAEYERRAAHCRLDAYSPPDAYEPLSARLWRRYGQDALAMLDEIERDPAAAELLIEGTEYRRCEIEYAAQREMIVTLEDFLRRRSKIALVTRRAEIAAAPGTREACRILFGADAERRFDEYFAADPQ